MRRIVTHPLASDFTAADISRYEYNISDSSKEIETLSFLTDIEEVDSTLRKHFNEEIPLLCSYWKEIGTALLDRGNMIEVYIILRRVRLLPDKEGKIRFIKWGKD